MFSSYLVIAFRNLAKYKIFSFVNVAGMAVSLASCLLISIFVIDELSYDLHHPDGERTYRVYNDVINQGSQSTLPILPYPAITVSFQSIRAALTNPIKNLRSE